MFLKRIACLWLLLCSAFSVVASQQAPDILLYKKQKYHLRTGWGHPSPLETYYHQNHLKYPFSMISTGNYRGHIATWRVEKQQLFLHSVDAGKGPQEPQEFAVKSKLSSKKTESAVLADWFSGVIFAESTERDKKSQMPVKHIYFHLRQGNVVDVQSVDVMRLTHGPHDKKSALKPGKDNTKAAEALEAMYRRYMAYYLRQGSNDIIAFKEGIGLLQGNKGLSPVLSLYNNDPMQWPYNWENAEQSGVPGGQWKVEGQRLYLTSMQLYHGLNLFEAEKKSLLLSTLFKDKIVKDRVFADWVSGVFIAELSEKETLANLSDRMTEFKATGAKIFRVNQGVVEQSFDLPKSFNPLAEKVDLPKGPLQLFKQWQKQMFAD